MPSPTGRPPAPAGPSPLCGTVLNDPPPPELLRAAPGPMDGPGVRDASTAVEGETAGEDLLSPAFVQVDRAFDLGVAAREGSKAASPLAHLADGQVVLLELVDGGTAITTAGRLRQRQEHWLASREEMGHRGLMPSALFSRLYSLRFGSDGLQRELDRGIQALVRERLGAALGEGLEVGASWLATKLLLQGIEGRLPCPPGLYRWRGGALEGQEPLGAEDPTLQADASQGLLLFLHGTGSSTGGSFGDLAAPSVGIWPLLESAFGGRIYGLEQRTFSASPIDNALTLAQSLPRGARLNLVSHGSGGLVADLLCAERIDDGLIDAYRYPPSEETSLSAQREAAAAEQRERLRDLRGVLAAKNLRVERYVRVACPARGTRLLDDNLDIFLSTLLNVLSGLAPLAGQPLLTVLKRLVLEVVRRRLDPHLVPGLAALAPNAPLADLLAQLPPQPGLAMATIAGQRDGGHPLQRLALLFSDSLFFQGCPNDLVVDTDAMQAGIAGRCGAHTRLEKGPTLHHGHYFSRPSISQALGRWLTDRRPLALTEFQPLAGDPGERERASTRESDAREAETASRGRGSGASLSRPVVVVLPGLMGSHLWHQIRQERLWFDPLDRAGGGLERLDDLQDVAIAPEKLFDLIYGDLCRALLRSHQVVRFPYDWRQPLDVLAERFGAVLRPLVAEADGRHPVRLLAHGMGGLVVRALIAREPDLWGRLIGQEGSRFLMLGTPNQGTHHSVATLLGQSAMIRHLARVSPELDLRQLVDRMGRFPGVLQLLPRPGAAPADGLPGADLLDACGPFGSAGWYDAALWRRLKALNRDRWFGDQVGATPDAATLARGRWLWDQLASADGIPGDPERVVYVYGQAPHTPCGVGLRQGQLLMLSTPAGDGVVTWNAGRVEGIGSFYLMAADHGGLPCRRDAFPALEALLREGRTEALAPMPQSRGARDGSPPPLPWQPGPVPLPSEEEVWRSLVGGGASALEEETKPPPLRVSCHAMDLRHVPHPLLVGHYEHDPIAAAEALIDRDIVAGELSSRNRLGLYAGPAGSATVVLMTGGAGQARPGRCRGAVVIGLGTMGALSTVALTEAVRVGVLRYLLHILDRTDSADKRHDTVDLASLLIGQNSSRDLHIEDSVTALVEGVMAANEQFAKSFPSETLRVGRLQLVEVYLDRAITATRALTSLEAKLNRNGRQPLAIERELRFGKGWRQRLDASQDTGYWPRMIITNGDSSEDGAPADGTDGGHRPGVRLANTLSFSFLGERARAETQQQQRQSGLVEALVEASIQTPSQNENLCRTLFQLLVPSAFKEVARHLEQLVLVLDDSTANLPWELLMADDKPLALQLALVRQLKAPRFRQRLQQSSGRGACVIGNPSSAGFFERFVGEGSQGSTGLASLDGARREAEQVLSLLERCGYACEASLEEENAVDVINKLYRHPYRLLHIAGHGVYEHPTRQGERRSGVVLAGGLLITAAEIEAMEVVPDLVFLNCCHLGTVKREPVAFNRLAASVAQQLIEMGVRAVVACGWAVDDQAALAFAEAFYTAMLSGTPFGQAIFLARKEAQAVMPNSNTWGAYQAYGDPAYQLETRQDGGGSGHWPATTGQAISALVTPLELIDRLQQLGLRIQHGVSQATGSDPHLTELRELLQVAPPAWLGKADVAVAVADVYAAFGGALQEEACRHYLAALRSHQASDGLPIRAIEQLAHLEARLGERNGDESRVLTAIERLRGLVRISADPLAPQPGSPGAGGPPEWQALLGGAYKRLAALRGRALLASGKRGKEALQSVMEPLEASIAAYGLAGGALSHQLNRLALEAVRDLSGPVEAKAIRHTKALLEEWRQGLHLDPTFWNGVALADGLLVEHLVDRRLAEDGASGDTAARRVLATYLDVFANMRGTPQERESVVEHLSLLGDVARARGQSRGDPCPACATLARRLESIGQALRDWETAIVPPPDGPAGSPQGEDGIETLT